MTGTDVGTWLMQDVSFHVPAGTSCALVGTSGSGKSTVLRLLYRSAPSLPVAAQPQQVSMSAGTFVGNLCASHQQAPPCCSAAVRLALLATASAAVKRLAASTMSHGYHQQRAMAAAHVCSNRRGSATPVAHCCSLRVA